MDLQTELDRYADDGNPHAPDPEERRVGFIYPSPPRVRVTRGPSLLGAFWAWLVRTWRGE